MALVSVILTTLNSERYLARSIKSCLQQTHHDLELLVVDGGSRDRTLEIVSSFADTRLRVIHQADNAGKLPGAINLGMANARGQFITWTQDDSGYEPDAIQVMVEQLEDHPNIGLVYTDFWWVDDRGERFKYQAVDPPELEFLLIHDVVGQCFLLRREVYEKIGPQDVQYFPVHEVPWRMKIARQFEMLALHRPLLYYTFHGESLTGRIGGWELQRLMARALLAEGHVDQGFFHKHMAQIDVDESFEAFVVRGDYEAFRRLAARGIRADWCHLRNVGYLKLLVVSFLPIRDAYQRRMQADWQAEQQALLSHYMAKTL